MANLIYSLANICIDIRRELQLLLTEGFCRKLDLCYCFFFWRRMRDGVADVAGI